MFFSAAKSLREGALHSQPSDDLVTLARRVISADADEIFSVLASVDASFVAAQTAIALESTCDERRYRETQMALAHVNRVATMRRYACRAGEIQHLADRHAGHRSSQEAQVRPF
jgi:hypothetical protein